MTQARFCSSCGAALAADDRFCEKCGAAVAAPPTATPPPPPPTVTPAPPPPAPVAYAPPPPAPLAAPAPPPPTPAVGYPWYLRPSVWVGITLLVFLLIGMFVMVRGKFAKPDTTALAGSDKPIASDLPQASESTKSESNDPIRDAVEKSGALQTETSSLEDATKAATGIQPYLGRWRITKSEDELKEEERLLEFVAEGEQVTAEVPALSARFSFTLESDTGALKGTFSNAKKSVPASAEYDAANDVLHIIISPPASEPALLTAERVKGE